MQRKKSIKEKQQLRNKSDWGGPQQDNQTQKEILTGSNTSLNENVSSKGDEEETGESELDEIKEGNLNEADLDQETEEDYLEDEDNADDDVDEEDANK